MTHSVETDKQKWRHEGGQDHQLRLTEADLGQVEAGRLRDRRKACDLWLQAEKELG